MSDLRGLVGVALGLLLLGVAGHWALLFVLQRAVLFPRPMPHFSPCDPNECPRPWDALRSFFAAHRLL